MQTINCRCPTVGFLEFTNPSTCGGTGQRPVMVNTTLRYLDQLDFVRLSERIGYFESVPDYNGAEVSVTYSQNSTKVCFTIKIIFSGKLNKISELI